MGGKKNTSTHCHKLRWEKVKGCGHKFTLSLAFFCTSVYIILLFIYLSSYH
jgi:hypothetical protein